MRGLMLGKVVCDFWEIFFLFSFFLFLFSFYLLQGANKNKREGGVM